MMAVNNSFGNDAGLVYVPNPNITNNKLNDSYFEQQGLANMTLDDSFDLVKRIYDQLDKCDTRFCQCTKSYPFIDLNYFPNDYSAMFRHPSFLSQAKSIVTTFIEKYKSGVLQPNALAKYSSDFILSFGPTLTKFLVNNDYSIQRLYVYTFSLKLNDFGPYFAPVDYRPVINNEISFFDHKK